MGKFFEKKNFGIPVTILVVLAYLTGYSLAKNLSGALIAAMLFAAAVFIFDFDDRVRNAVKHSYVFAIIFQLLYFAIELITAVIGFISGGISDFSSINDIFYSIRYLWNANIYLVSFITFLINAAVNIIYAVFIILALTGKDVKIGIIARILGEAPPKNPNRQQPNYYRPPVHPVPPVHPTAPGNQPHSAYPNANVPNNSQVNVQPVAPVSPQEPNVQAQPNNMHVQPNIVQVQPPYVQATSAQKSGQPNGVQADEKGHVPESQNANICSNCGKVNINEAIYCAACGTKLK